MVITNVKTLIPKYDDTPVSLTRQGPFSGRANESCEPSTVNGLRKGQRTHSDDILGDPTSSCCQTQNGLGNGRWRKSSGQKWRSS